MSTLKGKVALVTGSTSGIGLTVARALGAQGADVMLNGLGDATEIERTRANLEGELKVRVRYHGADMTKSEQIRDLVATCKRELGAVDILVNNAGVQHVAPIENFPEDKWDAIIAINLTAAFHTTKAVIPLMRARKWGRIINIASAHGLVASTEKAAYVAAKHGIVGLTKVTALEMAETPVTANAICPGFVLTPLVQKQVEARAARDGLTPAQAKVALVGEKHPSKEFVTQEQIGGLVVFLCSSAADQMRGSAFSIDGGWTAQ